MPTVIILTLQLRKQKHRELKDLVQGHGRGKWCSQDLNPVLLVHSLIGIIGMSFIWEALLRTKQAR